MSLVLYDLCGRDRSLRFSPYCWRIKLALAIKQLPYVTVATAFTEIPGAAGGASRTVPLIEDDGTLVSDSLEIALYLDRTYPDAPPLFAGETGVAAARFVEAWAYLTLHPIIMRMIVASIHDTLAPSDQAYFRPDREAKLGSALEQFQTGVEANTEALRTALEPLRRTLGRSQWLGGDEPMFVDCVPFGTLSWLNAINGRLPLAAEDPLRGWFDRCFDVYGRKAGAA